MGNSIREVPRALELEPVSLSELVHREIRVAIETAVHEELHAALATTPYERSQLRRGYRNGTKTRTLTGPTGPVALTLPHATLFAGAKEWTSRIVPRYHRRMPEVNEAIVATYLAGGNTRRIRGALQPLLRAATLSKSAVTSARSDGDPCRNGGAGSAVHVKGVGFVSTADDPCAARRPATRSRHRRRRPAQRRCSFRKASRSVSRLMLGASANGDCG
jgi:hypothetical protein